MIEGNFILALNPIQITQPIFARRNATRIVCLSVEIKRSFKIAECLISMALFQQGARAAESRGCISLLWLDQSERNTFSGTRKQSVGNECQRASNQQQCNQPS